MLEGGAWRGVSSEGAGGGGVEGWRGVSVYNLNTVGVVSMVTVDGVDGAGSVDNNGTFVDTVNMFRIRG